MFTIHNIKQYNFYKPNLILILNFISAMSLAKKVFFGNFCQPHKENLQMMCSYI